MESSKSALDPSNLLHHEDRVKLSDKHILIVDDDVIFSQITQDALTEAGYRVSVVSNGNTALTVLINHPEDYDLIILDRMMPELSGLDILGRLSALPNTHDIPVIMLTSHAGKSHLELAARYGVAETLFKPIQTQDLLRTIQKTFKKKDKDKNLFYN